MKEIKNTLVRIIVKFFEFKKKNRDKIIINSTFMKEFRCLLLSNNRYMFKYINQSIEWALNHPDYDFISLEPYVKNKLTNDEIYKSLLHLDQKLKQEVELIKKYLIKVINIRLNMTSKDVVQISMFDKKFRKYFDALTIVQDKDNTIYWDDVIYWAVLHPNYDFISLSLKYKNNLTNQEIYNYLLNIHKKYFEVEINLMTIVYTLHYIDNKKDLDIPFDNEEVLQRYYNYYIRYDNKEKIYQALVLVKENPNYNYNSLIDNKNFTNEEIYRYLCNIERVFRVTHII